MKKIKEILRRLGTAGLAAIMLTAQLPVTALAEEIKEPQAVVVSDEVLPAEVQMEDVLPGESESRIKEGTASEESDEDILNASETSDEAVQAGAAPLAEQEASEVTADEESSDTVEKQEEGADEQKAQESDKKDVDGDKENERQKDSTKKKFPAFSESKSIDGVRITVEADEGVFPEGATLSVKKVTLAQEKQAEEAVESERGEDKQVAASYTYDIKVLDQDGNELQPADESKVKVSFKLEEVADSNLETNIYHIKEADPNGTDSGEKAGNDKADSEETSEASGADSDNKVSDNMQLVAEKLTVETDGDTAIAETDGFSLYTVEFTYDNKQYVLSGDSEVALSKVLDTVGLTGEVSDVSVSDESLFSAKKCKASADGMTLEKDADGEPKEDENGTWFVFANQAFSTEEWMKVTIGGVVYEITVTDEMLTSVSYVDANGKVQTAENVEVVTTDMEGYEYKFVSSHHDGWLYVKNDVTLNGASNNASYPTNLILGDGATLTINGYLGIAYVDLTIYCQSGGTGKLVINANCISNPALFIQNSRTLIINGGTVEVKNSYVSGGGFGGNLVMNGGTASFEGGGNGIETGDTQTVAFNGGSLTAVGGGWGISDGTVTLDYKDITDQIKVSSYSTYNSSTVIIANGKYYKDDDGNLYSGTLTKEQKTAIAGKTLKPAIFHDISVDSSITGGSITAATTIAAEASSATGGQTVTLTAAPNEGYELDTVTVTKNGGGTVATSGTGNTRTFTMPEEAVTVSATFTLAPKTGSCGASASDHVTYTLTDTDKDNKYDKLEIVGSGAMADFQADGSNMPWYDHCKNIKTLTIAEGVTRIGTGAFRNVAGITSVNIPASVTGIGDNAFVFTEGINTALTTVSFASGSQCRSIGEAAFQYRRGLANITLPAELESIGDKAFYNDTALTSIDIPSKVTSIGDSVFYNCTNLATVRILGSPATIGSLAFYAATTGTPNGLTVYASAVNKTDALESLYEGSNGSPRNLVYICTAPEAPTANSLTYNGAEQTVAIAAPANCGYTVTGDKQTNVGSYTATATLNTGKNIEILKYGQIPITITKQYIWGDASTLTPAASGEIDAKTYPWSITPKPVTVSGIKAENKEYDATTTATLDCSGVTFAGKADGDSLTVTATGVFENTSAGEGKTVTISGLTLGGESVDNYTLAESGQQTSATATITAKTVKVSGIAADNKSYDGTDAATLNTTGAVFQGKLDQDTLTVTATGAFADKNVGEDKTVNISGLILGGESAGNYTLAESGQQTSTTANITPKSITGAAVTLSGVQQEYDGSEKSVSVSVQLGDTVLTGGTDYEVMGTTGTDEGPYSVTVTGKGNYTGTAAAAWEIVRRDANTRTFIGTIDWRDGGRDHTEPPALTLYRTTGAVPEDPAEGEPVTDVTPRWNGDNTIFTYSGLRVFADDGSPYSYWVIESPLDGYEAPQYHNTGTNPKNDRLEKGGKIINYIKQEKIVITGTVTWKHGGNPESNRPKTVTVHLQGNGLDLPYKVITLDGTKDEGSEDVELDPIDENTWRFRFGGLDKYDGSTAAEHIYTVREDHVANYTTTYDDSRLNITNTYNTNTLGDILRVRKTVDVPEGASAWTWDDNARFVFGLFGVSNTAGVTQPMPSGAVYDDGVYKLIEVNKNSAEQEAGFGAVSFDTPGTYVYSVRELTPAESGTSRLPGMTYDTEAYTVTIIVDEEMNLSAAVTDQAGKTVESAGGESTLTGKTNTDSYVLPFTNYFAGNQVDYVMAAGNSYTDSSQLDGDGRPLDVIGEVNGKFGFTMRPVGDNAASAPMPSDVYCSDTGTGLQGEGTDRVYYAKNVNGRVLFGADAAHAISFTAEQAGTYSYELAEIIPDDAVYIGGGFWYNDKDETVYDGVVHTLALTAQAEDGVLTVTLSENQSDTCLNPGTGTKYENAKNVARQDAAGIIDSTGYPRHKNGVPLFSNYKEPEIEVTAQKVWDDADNQDGMRPRHVYFLIERSDGQPFKDVYGNNLDSKVTIAGTDSANYQLEAKWSNLPRYRRRDDGTYEQITYKVFESANGEPSRNSVPGYADQVITGDDERGFTITNKHVPELRGVAVTMQWNDDDDRDGKRPEGVTFHLDQGKDGESTQTDYRLSITVSSDDGWKATWLDLPARYGDSSKEFGYVPRGEDISGYTAGGFVEGKASMQVRIPEGVTPLTDKVMVSLTENGSVTGVPIELSRAGSWTGTFEGVLTPSGTGGYSQYGVTINGIGSGIDSGDLQKTIIRNFTITGTHTPERRDLTVRKAWEMRGAGMVGVGQPDSIRVRLKANGKYLGDAVTLTNAENWQHTWSDLYVYEGGSPIDYTVEELNVPAYYTRSDEQSGDLYKITNTFNIDVTKAPAARPELAYYGDAQDLITAGEASNGTFLYALGQNADTAPADNLYSTSIPTATNAGTYYVWYKVIGDANHNDHVPETPVSVTIAKVEYTGTKTASATVRSGEATSGKTVALPALPEGASYASTGTAGGNMAALIDGTPSVEGTTLTFSTTSQDDQTTATITIHVTGATNYEDYDVVVTVTAKAKDETVVTITGIPPIVIEYGDTIVLSGSVQNPGTNGTWTWTSSDPEALKITPDGANATIEMMKVGTATITAKYESETTLGEAQSSLTVSQKQLGINWKNTSFTYDGTSHIPTATLSGVKSGDTCTVSVTGAQINAGSHTATASLTGTDSGNYALPEDKKTRSFTISKASISSATVTLGATLTYTGSEQSQSVSKVELSGRTINSSDYTVTNNSGRNAGSYTLTVTAKAGSNYTGSVRKTFTIAKKAMTPTVIVTDSYSYTGSAITPDYTVKNGSTIMAASEYTVSLSDNINAGEGKLTITAAAGGNYSFESVTKNFTIAKAAITPTVTVTGSYSYTGSAITPAYTVKNGSTTLAASEYTVSLSDNVEAGEGKLTVTAASGSNYSFEPVTKSFTIAKKAITPAVTVTGSYSYTGSAITPDYTVKNGSTAMDASDYTVSLSDNVEAGEGKLTVTAASGSNYSFEPVTKSFTIAKKAITPAVTVTGSYSYTGSAITPAYTVKNENATLDASEYTVSLSDNVAAGEGKLTITSASGGNYSFEPVIVSFTIAKAAIRPTVIVTGSYSYTGSAITPDYTVKNGSTIMAASEYTVSLSDNINAGEGKLTITAAAGGNYSFDPVTMSFTIAKAAHEDVQVSGKAKYGSNGTMALDSYIEAGGSIGTISVSDNSSVLSGEPSISGTTLSYNFADIAENFGKTAVVTVPVKDSTNYHDYAILIRLTVDCPHENTGIRNEKTATCTEQGYTGDRYCKDCGTLIQSGEATPIDPDNHAYDDGVITTQPTIFADGVKTYTCIRCHHTYTEVIPKVDDGEDHSDLIEDMKDLSGNNVPKVEAIKDETGKEIGKQILIGGEEVEKTVTDAEGNETVQTSIWIGGLESSYRYTGSAIKPSFNVYDGTKKLTSGTDYSVSYKNNKNAGDTATITISFNGNYNGTEQEKVTFAITPAVLGEDVVAADVTTYASGKTLKPVPTMKWPSTGKSIDKKNFTFAYKDAKGDDITEIKEAGQYKVVITSKNGSFTGETEAAITVTGSRKLLLSGATVKLSPNKYTYTGDPITPASGSYTLKLNGKNLAENTDYVVSEVTDNVNAGTATITFAAKEGNESGYVGTKSATFKIVKGRELKQDDGFTYSYSESVPYAKGGAKPAVVVKDGDDTLKAGTDYTVSYSKNTKVTNGATAVITITGKGNYKGSVKKYFTITVQDIEKLKDGISVDDKTESRKGYKNPTVTIIDLDGKKLKAGTDYVIDGASYSEPDENGVVMAKINGKGNYTGTASITYRYIKAAQNLSKTKVMKKIADKTYTGREVRLTDSDLTGILYTGNKKTHTYLIPGTDFVVLRYSNNTKSGTAKVTVKGIGSYGGTKTLTFKIRQKKGDYKGALVGGEWTKVQ